MKKLLTFLFSILFSLNALADSTGMPGGGVVAEVDPLAIHKDGSSTTTASIPFAEGISIGNGEVISFSATQNIYKNGAVLTLDATDTNEEILLNTGAADRIHILSSGIDINTLGDLDLTGNGISTGNIIHIGALNKLRNVSVSAPLAFSAPTLSLGRNTTNLRLTGIPQVLNTIQDIHTGASPEFTGLTLSGLTADTLTYANGSKALSSAVVSSPLSFSTGTLSLDDTAVTPGSYTNADITVDQKGRITAAANGSGGGGTPGGSDTEIQFNDGGAFGGNAGLVFDDSDIQLILEKSAIGVTQSDAYGVRLQNVTAATSGNPQYSPPLVFEGEAFRTGGGAAAKQTEWMFDNKTLSGTQDGVNHNTFVLQSSYAGGSYLPLTRWRYDPERTGFTQGFDVLGPGGAVTSNTYVFTVQNNASSVDMAFINSTFAVEGTGFFSAAGATFQIYATEGGGIEFIPDTSESLIAFRMEQTGNTTFQDTATSALPVLTLDQNDIDQAYIEYIGTSAADATRSLSTRNGDGVVDGPRNFSAAAGWSYVGMVRIEVNGVTRWMPFYQEDLS